MPRNEHSQNRVRDLRTQRGWTQSQLAERAGISRTAVTAIESDRLVPSVAAALSLAEALETSVEALFGKDSGTQQPPVWAWHPLDETTAGYEAEIGGRHVRYPLSAAPMWTPMPDRSVRQTSTESSQQANDTLVMATCDPAAGMLATQYAAATGLRMLVFERSSRQAAEMLRDGLVHLAGLHLSTPDSPDRNAEVVRQLLGSGFELIRVARWHEGIVLPSTSSLRTIKSVAQARLTWVGREPGSGARQCLDRILDGRKTPSRITRHHQGVTEAVTSGWADAGVCVQLVGLEAGLRFIPFQQEAYDVCVPNSLANDRRVKAFLNVVRSKSYRRLLDGLPGYDTSQTGEVVYTSR